MIIDLKWIYAALHIVTVCLFECHIKSCLNVMCCVMNSVVIQKEIKERFTRVISYYNFDDILHDVTVNAFVFSTNTSDVANNSDNLVVMLSGKALMFQLIDALK